MMNPARLILCQAFTIGILFAWLSPAAAETCRACQGLTEGGGDAFFELVTPKGQAYAPGKLDVYERRDGKCCLKGSSMTYPSPEVVDVRTKTKSLFLRGIDGQREGGFTRGILRYDLETAAMEPIATHIHGSKACKGGKVFALVQSPPIIERKKARSKRLRFEEYTLNVLNLDSPDGPQKSTVASGKHLEKEARLLSFAFSKDCKTLTYPGKKRGKQLTFKVPQEAAPASKADAQEIKVAVSGKIVSCPKIKQGDQPSFPVELTFTVEDVVPAGEIGTAGLKKLSYKVGKKAFKTFNMVYLTPETPVQVVLKGSDQIALKDFQVVSVEHR